MSVFAASECLVVRDSLCMGYIVYAKFIACDKMERSDWLKVT